MSKSLTRRATLAFTFVLCVVKAEIRFVGNIVTSNFVLLLSAVMYPLKCLLILENDICWY